MGHKSAASPLPQAPINQQIQGFRASCEHADIKHFGALYIARPPRPVLPRFAIAELKVRGPLSISFSSQKHSMEFYQ